ncbi:MAG: hypothetical protein DMG57_25950 [Acidobacteria bacterium]|nr:MAG: hypothetical protein DMG57_25950 [Acidobacteriota bacterium]
MGTRRFTRLTNAFSKKWENHWAAVSLWFAFYNFCRVHKSLRCTPAMEAKITDHIWAVRELLESGMIRYYLWSFTRTFPRGSISPVSGLYFISSKEMVRAENCPSLACCRL